MTLKESLICEAVERVTILNNVFTFQKSALNQLIVSIKFCLVVRIIKFVYFTAFFQNVRPWIILSIKNDLIDAGKQS